MIETIAVAKRFPDPDDPGVPAELPLDAVIFREDLYPRIEKSPATVQKYAEDHVADLLRAADLPLDMRFSVRYESQQYTAQMVEYAKANRRCLVLTREIVVWKVA